MADSRIGGSRKVTSRSGDATRLSMTKKRKKRRTRKANSAQVPQVPSPAASPTALVEASLGNDGAEDA